MIIIRQPRIEHLELTDRMISDIEVEGEVIPVWFEVPTEYGKYLAYERSDGFLIGMLSIAIREHHDIQCEAPVTEELLYQIQEILLPSLTKYGNGLYLSRITAEMAPALTNAGAVGTGLSCGVDSMHVISQFYHSKYPEMELTHFIFYNVGAFNDIYQDAGIDKVRAECCKRAQNCAEELGVPLIVTDSNFQWAFPQNHFFTHTFSSIFAVYMLQKLWKVFFYASTGHDYSKFTLLNNESIENGLYDLLSLKCFSTSMLTFYSEGGEKNRLEKQLDIADNPMAQKYLHVCTKTYYNCNLCNKCKRTLLIFDAIGKLDEYSDVFDIRYYKEHRRDYLAYCYSCHVHPEIDAHLEHAYELLKDDEEMQAIIRQSSGEEPQIKDYKHAYEELQEKYTTVSSDYESTLKSLQVSADDCSQRKIALERELTEMKETNTYKLMIKIREIGDGPFGPFLKKIFHGLLRIRAMFKRQ